MPWLTGMQSKLSFCPRNESCCCNMAIHSHAKSQLERCASSPDVEIPTISRFYLNQMIGDLSYSINKRTKGEIQIALIHLCDRLEIAERYGDGELDVW